MVAAGRPGGRGCWKLGGPVHRLGTRLPPPRSTPALAVLWVPGSAWTSTANKSASVASRPVGPDEGEGTDMVHFSSVTPRAGDQTALRGGAARALRSGAWRAAGWPGGGSRRLCVSGGARGPTDGRRGETASGPSVTQ